MEIENTDRDQIPSEWYLYNGVRHLGPLSVNEIKRRADEGRLNPEGHVWALGMSDWVPIQEIETLRAIVDTAQPYHEEPEEVATEARAELPVSNEGRSELPTAPVAAVSVPSTVEWTIPVSTYTGDIKYQGTELKSDPPLTPPLQKKFSGPLAIGLASSIVAMSASLFMFQSPQLPRINDVDRSAYLELVSAHDEPLKDVGAQAAIARSMKETDALAFYISTNLPAKTVLRLHLNGLPETLIDGFTAKKTVTVRVNPKGYAKIRIQNLDSGSLLPLGEYVLSVTCDQCKDPSAELVSKHFFLGTKDGLYDHRLKTYHDKMMQESRAELVEIHQLTETLEHQLNETESQYRVASGITGQPPVQPSRWSTFDEQWTSLQKQMTVMFNQWTPDFLSRELFYGSIYGLVKSTGLAISKVHETQGRLLSGFVDDAGKKLLSEEQFKAHSLLETLRSKIQYAEQLPPTANGMPRQDGL